MTFEDMQNVWSEMTEKLERQEHLTNQLIMDMTHQKFKNKIGTIKTFEGAGAVVCFLMAILLLFFLHKLDTWYLIACGIFVATYLFVAPLLILRSIYKMKSVAINTNSVGESLVEFTKRKQQFLFLQRIFIFSNLILILVILPVSSKIIKGKDLFLEDPTVWLWYGIIMFSFMVPFSIWGYRGYKRLTSSAEHLLQELQN